MTKKNKLICKWSKAINNFNFIYPDTADGKFLSGFFKLRIREAKNNFFEELEEKGYDLTTLKFEIEKKKNKESS